MPKKILLVDDHPLMLEALGTVVRKIRPEAEVVEVFSISAARDVIQRDRDFDLVLLDLRLPDTQGVSGLLGLKVNFPQLKVLVVSAYAHQETIENCFLVGANGFLSKSLRLEELEAAIDKIMAGEKVVRAKRSASESEDEASPIDTLNPLKRLTFQQARVLHHVCRGLLNKQIAYELGVGETTVKAHMREIFRKLDVVSCTQALVRIMRLEPYQVSANRAIERTAKTLTA